MSLEHNKYLLTCTDTQRVSHTENPLVVKDAVQNLLSSHLFITGISAHRTRILAFGDNSPLHGYYDSYPQHDKNFEMRAIGLLNLTTEEKEFYDELKERERALYPTVNAHWLFGAFRQKLYPALIAGHEIKGWYYNPNFSCRGVFLRLGDMYSGITVLQLDGGDSTGLYTNDTSQNHEEFMTYMYTQLIKASWISPSDAKWLIVSDIEFTIQEIARFGM